MQPSLPREIWTAIFETIDEEDEEDCIAVNLALLKTCRKLRHDRFSSLLNSLLAGTTYCEVVPLLYHHINDADMMHPAFLPSLLQKPALAESVQSVEWAIELALTPTEDFSYPIDAVDFATPTAFEASLVKLAIIEAVSKVQAYNEKCLVVLRLCSNVTSLSCISTADAGHYSEDLLKAYLEHQSPFLKAEALAQLPFFHTLRQFTLVEVGPVDCSQQGWLSRDLAFALKSSTVLETLDVPLGFQVLSMRQHHVTKLVIRQPEHHPQPDLHDCLLSNYRPNFPALRTFETTFDTVTTYLQIGATIAANVEKSRLVVRNTEWSEYLSEWLAVSLSSMPCCHTLSIELRRSHDDNFPTCLPHIIGLMASNNLFSASVRRLEVAVVTRGNRLNSGSATHSDFVPADTFIPLFEPSAFPNLQHLIITTDIDSKIRALKVMGHIATEPMPEYPQSDFFLLDNFRKLVAASLPNHKDSRIEWKLGSVRVPHMWTRISKIKKEAGSIKVQHQD